jgi:hypothetical protein
MPDPVHERERRILIVSRRSDPTIATEGLFVSELAQALAELGHHVEVASGPPYPELDARTTLFELPAPVRSPRSVIDMIEGLGWEIGANTKSFLFGRRLVRFVQSRPIPYDLVLDNQTLCWGLLKLRRISTPVISIVHDINVPLMPRRILKRLDRIVVASPEAFEELGRNPEIDRRKLALIPRGRGGKAERAVAVIEALYADLPGRSAPDPANAR